MANRSLRVAAAYHALGLAKTDQLINSADEALNDGVYSLSLGELYSPSNPTWADCSRLFIATLKELDIPLPDPVPAITTLLEFHLIRMLEGEVTEDEVLSEIYSIDNSLRFNFPKIQVSVEVFDQLRPFVFSYHELEHYRDYQNYRASESLQQPGNDELENLYDTVRSLANEWCQRSWVPEIDPSWLTSDVQALGNSILYSKAFELLPIFADALQDAGCENESILGHLRGGTMHLRGCVFVEMILNRKLLGNKR